METIFVDGSTGEGGGQILRTSLTLACITGKNLHIENIRAARRNPGLAKQHLSCVQAACKICNGQCQEATSGSQVLDFQPGPIRGGDFSFDIGSAGSASLVIQTVLPALFLADKPSTVAVTGGTHNPMAPPFDFLRETFLPAIAVAGFGGDCRLVKHGFFPAGGGKIAFDIRLWRKDADHRIDLCERPENMQIHARIYTAKLPAHIAERQRGLLLQSSLKIENIEHVEVTDSDGPGNCVMLRLCGGRTTVFTAFGKRGRPSEEVVNEVVNLAGDFLAGGAAIDRFLADQLLIYMAISNPRPGGEKPAPAQAGGRYTTNELSTHLATNIETIKQFLPVDFKTENQDRIYRISCVPA